MNLTCFRRPFMLPLAVVAALAFLPGCDSTRTPTADQVQTAQQERLAREGTRQTGMPAIKNFRERKLLKDILELRDQEGLTTFTYIVAENTGKLVFLGETIGYGIPAATQYTSPQKVVKNNGYEHDYSVVPQADPNGLFSPQSAEGTWVMMKNPNGPEVVPVYIEPRVIVSPFRLKSE